MSDGRPWPPSINPVGVGGTTVSAGGTAGTTADSGGNAGTTGDTGGTGGFGGVTEPTVATLAGHDFVDLHADDSGGVVLLNRDAAGGGHLNCGKFDNLCGNAQPALRVARSPGMRASTAGKRPALAAGLGVGAVKPASGLVLGDLRRV